MPTLLTVAEFKYPKSIGGQEVLDQDCRQLLTAMKKKFPNANFTCGIKSAKSELVVALEVVGANDFQRVGMTYFAEGFMASAHLWER